jgi:L-fuconolactonase
VHRLLSGRPTTTHHLKIDAHHHFWKYSATEYEWIDETMRVLRRDFLVSNLEKEIRDAGIDGVVTVQARQTLEETRWLLALAAQNAFIRAVVGWVPLVDSSVSDQWESLVANRSLCGVRHVVQNEPDGFLIRKDFNNGISLLRKTGLVYDLLIRERQLPEAILFVDQHPQQVFVLDHLAKPRIKEQSVEPWRKNLKELARRQNVYCKISGLVTEADVTTWNEGLLRPYMETALETFGPARLMFGSDWPVCLVASSYRRWYDTVCSFAASLSPAEKADIFGGTAERAYRLPRRE